MSPHHKLRQTILELSAIALRLRQAWSFIEKRHRFSLFLAMGTMIVGAWLNARIPVTLGDLATTLEAARSNGRTWTVSEVVPVIVLLALYFVVREGLQVARKFLVHKTAAQIEKEVTVSLVDHVLRLDLSRLQSERLGALHGRLRRGIEGLIRILMLSWMDFLPALLTASFALAVAIKRNAILGLLMAGVVPVAIVLVVRQILSQRGIRIALMRGKENLDATFLEQVGGIEYIRAANTEEREISKVRQAAEVVRKTELSHHFTMSLFDGGKALNEGFFFIAVVAGSLGFAATGQIRTGEIITFAMLFGSVLAPLREVHRIVDEAAENALKVGDLVDVFHEPVDPSFVGDLAYIPHDDWVFSASKLCVSYGAENKANHVLRDVSFAIRRGETIGIAGRSGCGKSTLIKVLLRLIRSDQGTLTVGGVPIERISRQAIGESIGYVGQTPYLFAGTIADNISYGCDSATPDRITQAARCACIHDEILSFSGGYESRVAERGQNFSVGQRQRIALARVFLKNPPILILDEGTASLDNISERRVQDALEKARVGRTTILIAHRLSTLQDSDRILVIEDGQICESGSYEDLVSQEGVFARLVKSGSLSGRRSSSVANAGASSDRPYNRPLAGSVP